MKKVRKQGSSNIEMESKFFFMKKRETKYMMVNY